MYGDITYRLIGAEQLFTVDADGYITNLREFDFEAGEREFIFLAEAEDLGGLKTAARVTVIVTDQNEHSPQFESIAYLKNISENFVGNALRVKATDEDGSEAYGSVAYMLSTNHPKFSIDSVTGQIAVLDPFDFESEGSQSITISVVGADGGGLQTSVQVTFVITDVNEYAPSFSQSSYYHCVSENTPTGTSILMVRASDDDSGLLYGTVESYTLMHSSQLPFEVSQDGQLLVSDSLSNLEGTTFQFEVVAMDGGGRSSQPVPVSICILDVNNHPPRFTRLRYSVVVTEMMMSQEPLVQLQVTDMDNNSTEILGVSFILASYSNFFDVEVDGSVMLKTPLDFEQHQELVLEVAAFDGIFYSAENATVHISVYPLNEHKPQFSRATYETFLPENSPTGSLQLEISVTDLDHNPPTELITSLGAHGNVVSVTFSSGPVDSFQITFDADFGTATISNLRSFDFENDKGQFVLTLVAEDGGRLTSDEVEVVISIIDQNDERPEFLQPSYQFNLSENFAGILGQVKAVDADVSYIYSQINYEIITMSSDSAPVSIWQNGSLELLLPLDYETDQREFNFIIQAADSAGLNSTVQVQLSLTDVNEFAPEFLSLPDELDIHENMPVGSILLTAMVTDDDGGVFGELQPLELAQGEVESQWLELQENGSLQVIAVVDYESIHHPVFNITLKVCDNGDLCASHSVEVTVIDLNEYPPVFDQVEYTLSLMENTFPFPHPGWPENALLELQVTDKDSSTSGFTFTILSSTSNAFFVDGEGFIVLLATLDYEELPSIHTVTVQASDGSLTSLVPATITIEVVNVNDNPPFVQLSPVPIPVSYTHLTLPTIYSV